MYGNINPSSRHHRYNNEVNYLRTAAYGFSSTSSYIRVLLPRERHHVFARASCATPGTELAVQPQYQKVALIYVVSKTRPSPPVFPCISPNLALRLNNTIPPRHDKTSSCRQARCSAAAIQFPSFPNNKSVQVCNNPLSLPTHPCSQCTLLSNPPLPNNHSTHPIKAFRTNNQKKRMM